MRASPDPKFQSRPQPSGQASSEAVAVNGRQCVWAPGGVERIPHRVARCRARGWPFSRFRPRFLFRIGARSDPPNRLAHGMPRTGDARVGRRSLPGAGDEGLALRELPIEAADGVFQPLDAERELARVVQRQRDVGQPLIDHRTVL